MERYEFLQKCKEVVDYWQDQMPMKTCEEASILIRVISKKELYPKDEEVTQALEKEIADMYISLMCLQQYYRLNELSIERAIEEKLGKKY